MRCPKGAQKGRARWRGQVLLSEEAHGKGRKELHNAAEGALIEVEGRVVVVAARSGALTVGTGVAVKAGEGGEKLGIVVRAAGGVVGRGKGEALSLIHI